MDHADIIKEQFTKQALTFGTMAGHFEALDLIVRMTQAGEKDNVLDVACGPGIVASAFAPKVREVKGIDLVPAMIEQARKMQADKKLSNMSWDIGPADPLPYAHCTYSVVVSRFSFHHLTDPGRVLKEMARVAAWDGRVAVIDVFVTDPQQSALYDTMEKLRDPSHTRALFLDELAQMFEQADLSIIDRHYYRLEVDVDELLKATHTPGPQGNQVKHMIQDDVVYNRMGIEARIKNGKLTFSFPVVIIVGKKEIPPNYGLSCCS